MALQNLAELMSQVQPCRRVWLGVGLVLASAGGCGPGPSAGPPSLSPAEEQAILERVNQSQAQEGQAPQPTTSDAAPY